MSKDDRGSGQNLQWIPAPPKQQLSKYDRESARRELHLIPTPPKMQPIDEDLSNGLDLWACSIVSLAMVGVAKNKTQLSISSEEGLTRLMRMLPGIRWPEKYSFEDRYYRILAQMVANKLRAQLASRSDLKAEFLLIEGGWTLIIGPK
jgi:hypothetical protein